MFPYTHVWLLMYAFILQGASVATWEHFRLFVLIGRQLHIKYTLYECLTPNPLNER